MNGKIAVHSHWGDMSMCTTGFVALCLQVNIAVVVVPAFSAKPVLFIEVILFKISSIGSIIKFIVAFY